jgi:hypothetical protein
MLNSRATVIKHSTYDKKIQDFLVINIVLQVASTQQVAICALLATGYILWISHNPAYGRLDRARAGRSVGSWFVSFMSWMLLMT